jgi:hypothetical protein
VSELRRVGKVEEQDVEVFWSQVKTNLQAGRIRLVFVADEIPQELRRIVEFLNIQMDPAEVLAVEIKQYVSDEFKTLIPRVIGQRAKTPTTTRKWDETSFFSALGQRSGTEEVAVARRILEWAADKGLRISWGGGSRDGSLFPVVDHRGMWYTLIAVWTYGRVEMQFQHMQNWAPFDDESKRLELVHRLNEIPGVSIPEDAICRRPAFPHHSGTVLRCNVSRMRWTGPSKSTGTHSSLGGGGAGRSMSTRPYGADASYEESVLR